MKHDVMPSIVKMGKTPFKELVKEVKETVATDLAKPKTEKKSIRVVDLWNIHRQVRPANNNNKKRGI